MSAGISVAARGLIALNELMKKFPDSVFRRIEGFASERRRAIDPPQRFAVPLLSRFQVPLPFQSLEQRIEASGAYAITVPRELLDHSEAENRTLHGMVQNVEAD
jgi:hypothetical protein